MAFPVSLSCCRGEARRDGKKEGERMKPGSGLHSQCMNWKEETKRGNENFNNKDKEEIVSFPD